MDVLNAAVNLAPVPYLNLAFSVFQLIVQSVEQVQSNKELLEVLKDGTGKLLHTINHHYHAKKLKISSTQAAIGDLNNLLQEILAFVKKQLSRNFLRLLFTKDQTKAQIENYLQRLQLTMNAFQVTALINIEALQLKSHEAHRKDQEQLNVKLGQLQANQEQLLDMLNNAAGTQGKGDRHAVVTTMQLRLNRREGDNAELQFYRRTLQQLPRDEQSKIKDEIHSWAVSPFDVERGVAIGSGGYGTVYKGTWKSQPVAIKVMTTTDNVCPDPLVIRHEISIWAKLDHPNIIKFLGANILNDEPFILMPLAEYGNAKRYLEVNPRCNRTKLLRDVAVGLAYLHDEKEIVHGDIKAVNILIDSDKNGPRALLCDFGLASIKSSLRTRSKIDLSSIVGTQNYMAPEMFKGVPPRYSGDIYALGMTMYEIFTGEVPLGFHPFAVLYTLVVDRDVRPDRPTPTEAPQLTNDLWDLIIRCWKRAPADRPSAREVRDTLKGLAGRTVHRRRENGSVSSGPRHPVLRREPSPSDPGQGGSGGGNSVRKPHVKSKTATPGLDHSMISSLLSLQPSSANVTPSRTPPPPYLNVPNASDSSSSNGRPSRTPSPGLGRRTASQDQGDSQFLISPTSSVSSSATTPTSPRLQAPSTIRPSRSATSLIPTFLDNLVESTSIAFPMMRPWRFCTVLTNPSLVTSTALSSDGNVLVAGLANGHFEVWNPHKGAKMFPESEPLFRPNISSFPIVATTAPNRRSSTFAVASMNGVVAQHHMDLGATNKRFYANERAWCISLIRQGETDELLILNDRGEIVIWPMSLDQDQDHIVPEVYPIFQLQVEGIKIQTGRFSSDGSRLFVGTSTGHLYVINTSNGQLIRDPLPYRERPTPGSQISCKSLTLSPDGRTAIVGYSTGEIRMWDVITGKHSTMRPHPRLSDPKLKNRSIELTFTQDGKKIAYPSLSRDKTIEVQDVLSRKIVATVELKTTSPSSRTPAEGVPPCPAKRIENIHISENNKLLIVSFRESADIFVWSWQ